MNWYLKVLNQYVDFKGRARRKEYWMFTLVSTLISWIISFFIIFFEAPEFGIIESLYSLGVFLPSIAVGVRRMHDVGKSGWYLLIPIYNLILACTDSEVGPNEWGDNPKGIGNKSEIDFIGIE